MKYIILISFSIMLTSCTTVNEVNQSKLDTSFEGKYETNFTMFAYPLPSNIVVKDGAIQNFNLIEQNIKLTKTITSNSSKIPVDSNLENSTCNTNGNIAINDFWSYATLEKGKCLIKSINSVCDITLDGKGYIFKEGTLVESGQVALECPSQSYIGSYYITDGKKISSLN